MDRLKFRKGDGEDAEFGTGKEFTLLALSCVKKVEGAGARAARNSAAGEFCARKVEVGGRGGCVGGGGGGHGGGGSVFVCVCVFFVTSTVNG